MRLSLQKHSKVIRLSLLVVGQLSTAVLNLAVVVDHCASPLESTCGADDGKIAMSGIMVEERTEIQLSSA
jgi:predicted TIM-barrel fold metal-dependent hydrolase